MTIDSDERYELAPSESSPRGGQASGQPVIIDTRPLIRAVLQDRRQQVDPAIIARRFHNTLATTIVQTWSESRPRPTSTALYSVAVCS